MSPARKRSLVMLMDPIEQCNLEKDTSFALLLSAQVAGYTLYHLAADDVGYTPTGLYVTPIRVYDDLNHPVDKRPKQWLSADDCGLVFIRLDPPFNQQYLRITWLLDRLPIPVINAPAGLRTVNEKLWALGRPYTPPTIVTACFKTYYDFLQTHATVIIKPTDGFGGSGIFKITASDSNHRVAFETLASMGPVIVQKAIDSVGNKRVLLLNGRPLGAILRQQTTANDHRHNLAAGGLAKPTEITELDRNIIASVADELVSLGLSFVGLDIIGDHLIEVNVTSPMGIRELSRFTGKDMAAPVIAFLESYL